jgi:large subunit ribosomal protein L30
MAQSEEKNSDNSAANTSKIRVKLVHSPIGTTARVRETLKGLGLNRIGRERELTRTPSVEGMLRRVVHLVTEVKG